MLEIQRPGTTLSLTRNGSLTPLPIRHSHPTPFVVVFLRESPMISLVKVSDVLAAETGVRPPTVINTTTMTPQPIGLAG